MLLFKLFLSFIQVGLFSVGGGYAAIPLIQDRIVNQHHLLTLPEFTDLITIAEMTPGPISINSSTFVGMRLNGPLGAILCTLGCILPSFIICLTLAYFYVKYRNLKQVQTVLSSLRPAVVAMIGAAGLSILMLALFNGKSVSIDNLRYVETLLFLASLYLLKKFKVNAITIILGSGVVGVLLSLALNIA